jgi:hypothetical protein
MTALVALAPHLGQAETFQLELPLQESLDIARAAEPSSSGASVPGGVFKSNRTFFASSIRIACNPKG